MDFTKIDSLIIPHFERDFNKCKCNYCSKSEFFGHLFKCLECFEYNLCSQCFEKRKFNESHQSGHRFLHFVESDLSVCGTYLNGKHIYLENLKEKFSQTIHLNVKCNNCKCKPIKGLRFKCDTCIDLNLCEMCSEKSFEKHQLTHPLLVYCQTISANLNANEVYLDEKLFRCGFAQVFKAKYKNRSVICKKIEARKERKCENLIGSYEYDLFKKSFFNECNALKQIQSENILKMIGFCCIEVNNGDHDFLIITEAIKSNLVDFIKNESNLSHKLKFDISHGIAMGMIRIHTMGFIHHDLRTANIWLASSNVPKIGDMSKVSMCEEDISKFDFSSDSKKYMPPEFYSTGVVTNKFDVFTFGLTLNELFGGKHKCSNKKIEIIQKGEPFFDDLISDCISDDACNRATSREIESKLSFIITSMREQQCYSDDNSKFRLKFYYCMRNYREKQNELVKENRKLKRAYYEKLLKREETFNSSRIDSQLPSILNTLRHLEYLDENKTKCLELCQKYLTKAKEIVNGKKHIEIASALAVFGYVNLHLIKDYKKALSYYEKAAKMNKALLGEDCHAVANNYFRIGDCYYEMKSYTKALEYHLNSLEIRRSIYECNCDYLVSSLNKVQTCYLQLGNMVKFLRYRREEINIKRDVYKLEHPDKVYYDMFIVRGKDNGREAWHYIVIDNEAKYEQLKKQKSGTNIDVSDFGRIIKSGWGKNPPSDVEERLNNMYSLEYPQFKKFKLNGKSIEACMYESNNQDPILSSLYGELKHEYEFNNGEQNLSVIDSLLDLQRYYVEEMQDAYNSFIIGDKCLEICVGIFSKEANRYTAQALYWKGCCYLWFIKDEGKALALFEKVLEMRQKLFGREHPGVAEAFFKIGMCHLKLNKINDALNNLFQCLEIRKQIYTNQSKIHIVHVLTEILNCLEKLNETDKLNKYKLESLEIKRELFKKKHSEKEFQNVCLIKSKENDEPIWSYILIENELKYEELKKTTIRLVDDDVTQFGKIVYSGKGFNPPANIIEKMNKEYGYDQD